MTDVLVERRWDPPLASADIQALIATSGGCLAAHRCDWRGSLLTDAQASIPQPERGVVGEKQVEDAHCLRILRYAVRRTLP